MGGSFAELISTHGARLFAFWRATTPDEPIAAWFVRETFRLMAEVRVDLDPDVDPDVMVYRFALRVRGRFDVPAPAPDDALARMFHGVEPDDALAFVLLEAGRLGIEGTANALRRPQARLQDALATALATMTRVAGEPLEATAEDAVDDAMVAKAALRWLDTDDRAVVDRDPTAAPRKAAMECVLADLRALLEPCDPPAGMLAEVEAAVETCLQKEAALAPTKPRRRGHVAAIAIGAAALLVAGAFAAVQLRGDATVDADAELQASEAESDVEDAPERAPTLEPPAPAPEVEVAAQGPSSPADPRLDQASALARKHRCKQAVKLLMSVVDDSPSSTDVAVRSAEPCRGWLKKLRTDATVIRFKRLLAARPR
jgi:hypothetical protein